MKVAQPTSANKSKKSEKAATRATSRAQKDEEKVREANRKLSEGSGLTLYSLSGLKVTDSAVAARDVNRDMKVHFLPTPPNASDRNATDSIQLLEMHPGAPSSRPGPDPRYVAPALAGEMMEATEEMEVSRLAERLGLMDGRLAEVSSTVCAIEREVKEQASVPPQLVDLQKSQETVLREVERLDGLTGSHFVLHQQKIEEIDVRKNLEAFQGQTQKAISELEGNQTEARGETEWRLVETEEAL
jgi:hypothetical protein